MSHFARILLFITIITHFEAVFAFEATALFGNLFKDSTISFGNPAPLKPLPTNRLRMFVWNIHKGEDQKLTRDFGNLSYGSDIALFQEAISNHEFVKAITLANPVFEWTMAKAFQQFDASYTGVATGSRVKPLRHDVIVSDVTEPVTETPKTILLSEFSLENDSETLLVANVHGINFVGIDSFKIQMHQLLNKIRNHRGPLVVAGDFNTWNPARAAFLEEIFFPLGLKQIDTPVAGFFDLDHIFVRGLKARFVFDLSHIESSDHAPLLVDFLFEKNKVMNYEAGL